ncbi:glycosyltransferase family 4 protein [Candidatus Bathyarchaeota archaeon]|nr:MAG: glycosyltransferase family 4 protein [Candidatus Bathyarchaeota archaeon]
MRIVLVHPRMSVMGGGERVAIHSIKEALREGHEVYLACERFNVDAFEDFFGVQGLFKNVRLLTYAPFRPVIQRAVLYQRLIYHQLRLRSIVSKRRGFELILNTAEVANHPGRRLPSIEYCYFPDYFSHLETNTLPNLWELYYSPARLFYHSRVSHIDRLLAVSDYTREFVKEKWGRDSTTLYPPCPIDLYSDLRDQPKENLVVTVGRIGPEKRIELFLEIARRMPSVRFAIIGSVASEKESYSNILRKVAPSNIAWVVAPLRKVKEMLGQAKVYVHCALNEHFGITIVEAMAAGCVPVVHNSGGAREVVTNNVGCKWNTPAEAVSQISNLIKNDVLRREFSKAAAARSKMFGPKVFELGLGSVLREYQK